MSQSNPISVSPLSFLRLFLPLALLLIGGAGLYGNQEIERELTLLRNQETTNARLEAGALSSKIEFLNHDLTFLSRHSALRDAVNQPSPKSLAHLAEDFATFSGSRGHYDQIRWIDQNGMEIVRVDYAQGKAFAVPADKLQNKRERYYFTDTIKLNPGEISLSPLDLNIEHNKIEVPYKPMARIATPVADSQGNKRGIVILNYYGNDLLQAFTDATAGIADHSMLINDEGYWLKSPNSSDEWGFMFNRPELSMAVRSPAAWERIRSADEGQQELDDGLWTWETIYPLKIGQNARLGVNDDFSPSRGEMEYRQYFWKSVEHLSAKTLSDIRQAIWLKVGWIVGLLLGFAGLGSWLLVRSWSLLASERVKFRTLADFTYDWETWIDQNGHYVYCSPSCIRITGRSANEFMADPNLLLNITHPDDRGRMETHLQRHAAADAPYMFEVRIVLPDGQLRWLEHVCQSVFGETGEFLGRRASNRDITERKQAENMLRENEARLKELFENLSSGVAVYQASPDGQDFIITAFNGAAERIENMRREDFIGKNVVEVFPGIAEFGLLEVFRRVWQNGVAEHFPISFYQDGRIAGWRNNYVYKLPNGEIVAIYDDVTKEKQAEEKIHYLAHYDPLTALPNRTLFADRLQQAITTAKRGKAHIALMFLDLDKFKPVNDELGHDVGDQLLKEVAKRLLNCVRESDTVSRIGGDEFVVLLPAIEAEQDAMLVAEKMLYTLNQPFELADHSISISGSIGIAVYPEHGSDEKMLTKNADVAMYYAKNGGRNNARIYQADMVGG